MISKQTINKISNRLSIIDLVRHYSELTLRGENLIGACPLCRSPKGFTISPKKNICKCFACGKGGGPINFIKYFENLDFKLTVDFILIKFINTVKIENISGNLIRGSVYVLQLEDNCFYIGFTRNIKQRLNDHFKGNGSIWTKKHKPISVIKVHEDKTLNFENYLTEKAILKYGYEFIRGGDHIFFNKKYGTKKE